MVEHLLPKQRVAGSNPVSCSMKNDLNSFLLRCEALIFSLRTFQYASEKSTPRLA